VCSFLAKKFENALGRPADYLWEFDIRLLKSMKKSIGLVLKALALNEACDESLQLQKPLTRHAEEGAGHVLPHGFGFITEEFLQMFRALIPDDIMREVSRVHIRGCFPHRFTA
jgi:hypothetical protein